MTTEMTDAELNKAVAEEVMQWTPDHNRRSQYKDRDGKHVEWMDAAHNDGWPEFEDDPPHFRPATDYAAMGEVIEAMEAKGLDWYASKQPGGYVVDFYRGPECLNTEQVNKPLPRAVALAALQACRKEAGK